MINLIKQILITSGFQNVYLTTAPENASDCIWITLSDGQAPTSYFGIPESTKYPFVGITCRSQSGESVLRSCNDIKRLLHKYHDDQIAGILQVGDTAILGRDPLGRLEALVTFRIITEE